MSTTFSVTYHAVLHFFFILVIIFISNSKLSRIVSKKNYVNNLQKINNAEHYYEVHLYIQKQLQTEL